MILKSIVSNFIWCYVSARRNFFKLSIVTLPRPTHSWLVPRPFVTHCASALNEELKMGLKFCIICGLFQLLLVILFAVLADYSDHASPPHKRKGETKTTPNVSETLPVNDISIYYPSKSYLQCIFL